MSFIGKQIEMGVSVEGTRGSAESITSKWVKNTTADIILNTEKVVDDNSQGRIEDSVGQRTTQKWLEGSLEGILHVDPVGYFFKQLYGDLNTTTVSEGSVYSHEFTVANDIDNPTLSIFLKDGSVKEKVYNGAVVSSFELSADIDDYVRYTTDLIAREEADSTNTPSYDNEYDFVARDITLKIANTEGGLTSATAVDAKNLDITWDAGAIRDHVFGSYNPNDIYNANFSIEGSFEKNYEDSTFRDLWKDDDAKYMEITIEGEANIGDENNPSITILLNKVKITDWSRGGGNEDLVTEDVSFKAFYNEDDDQQSKVTVQNTTDNYNEPY